MILPNAIGAGSIAKALRRRMLSPMDKERSSNLTHLKEGKRLSFPRTRNHQKVSKFLVQVSSILVKVPVRHEHVSNPAGCVNKVDDGTNYEEDEENLSTSG